MNEYVIAKYIRLSRDDGATESLSIPNQHALLDRHIAQMDIHSTNILEFVDNGYTGTNFERPAMQEMLELVRVGKIHCILCKDFSRFGRNILETGYFIEQVFPLYGVRFIAVTDNYDSIDYKGNTGGIDIAFKFLIHEHYSKDLSRKIKSAKRIKMVNGESITANARYGYIKGQSGKLEIDESAAAAIRLIFEMALAGDKTPKICNALFAAKHPTPAEHKALQKGKPITSNYLWSTAMVTKILHNEQYIGTYVSGREERIAIGVGKQVDESEWIKIPNHHPAIISKDDFLQIQVIQPQKKHDRSKARKSRDYLLLGKIYCGCCRRALQYHVTKNATFNCIHTQANPNAECYMLKAGVRDIDEAVLTMIKAQAEVVLTTSDFSELRKMNTGGHQLAECQRQIRQLMEQRQKHYESFVLKEISAGTYRSLKEDCSRQLERLNNQLNLLKQAERDDQADMNVTALARDVLDESALPRDIVASLVDKVFVFPEGHIEIQWKFANFAVGA